jgi:glycine amidinotransferase
MRVVNSWNEWDSLKEVIIGRAYGACVPPYEPAYLIKSEGRVAQPNFSGPHDADSILAAAKQQEHLCDVLRDLGITVRRPDETDFNVPVETPDWRIPHQNACSCPRDTLLVLGNEILEAPMSWRSRFFEYRPYRTILNDYFRRDPHFRWEAAPRPLMTDNLYEHGLPKLSSQRKETAAQHLFTNTEAEPVFDAADCLRFGKDLFMQHGYTTNRSGISWLRRHVGSSFRMHEIGFQNNLSPTHTDAQLLPIRPYLCLSCPERPLEPSSLALFKDDDCDWEVISAPPPNSHIMPPKCTSSPWLSMNLLSIDENTIIVEETEAPTIKFLRDEFGFDVIPVPFRDAYKFGGSFHCQSVDVHREGVQRSYFPNLERMRERLSDMPRSESMLSTQLTEWSSPPSASPNNDRSSSPVSDTSATSV